MIGTMYIDGIPLKNYGAVLSNWNPGTPSISNMITPGEDYSFPTLLHSEITPKTLTAKVHIIGKNYAEASRKMSALILALNKTTDLQMPDGFYYRSVLTEVSDLEWTNRHIAEFTLTFQSVQHGPYISISPYTAGTPIYYSGTAPAGMKIEFDAPSDIQNMTLKIVKNLETKFGTSVKFSDAAELYRALISGNQMQDGTGIPSFENVRPIHGVTKITVNGMDYALPRELFTDDYYDPISGQGQAKKNKAIFDGSPDEEWFTDAIINSSLLRCSIQVPAANVPAANVGDSDRLQYGSPYYTNKECWGFDSWGGQTKLSIVVLKSRITGWSDSWTDAQKVTAFKTFLNANPLSVLYSLATPQPITGTPILSAVPANTLISVDNGGTVTTTSGNTKQDIQLITIPSGAHIVLDGIEKIITQNGENKFADTNLVDFPALEPSETAYAVQVSKPVSNLSVGYYPTYI